MQKSDPMKEYDANPKQQYKLVGSQSHKIETQRKIFKLRSDPLP